MRILYFTLLAAVTLLTSAVGCNHAQTVGSPDGGCTSCGGSSPAVVYPTPSMAEPPMK